MGDKAIRPVLERLTEDRLRRGKLLGRLSQKEVLDWLDQRTNPYRELMTYYRCAMMEVETKFNVLNEELSLQYDRNPIESIKSRLKEPESILEKMKRKGLPLTIESIEDNIFDVAGVRVICSFPEDIYMLTDCLLRQDDITLITRKDYIKNPKESGYRSLHLIVEVPIFLHDQKKMMKVEVQMRTIAMDFWASLEHKIRYKKDLPQAVAISDELRQCSEMSAQLDARMEAVRRWIEHGGGEPPAAGMSPNNKME
ncbi:MAG: GTP pyrophosphokinase family protein [Clostridiales bacterium]|nr:GTP pyrophosphokinase family protein [Clostridiales bacterium]